MEKELIKIRNNEKITNTVINLNSQTEPVVHKLATQKENEEKKEKKKRCRSVKDRMRNLKLKHPLRTAACNCNEKKCTEYFGEIERNKIYTEF